SQKSVLLDPHASTRELLPMQPANNLGWWIAGTAALLLVVGFVLPHHAFSAVTTASIAPAASGTVPAQLLAADQTANPSAAPSPPPQIAVYICGNVRRPGVYTFRSGLRVADGIARAGGALPQADLEQLNLAEPLTDAMKIDVPKKGQIIATRLNDDTASSGNRRSHRRSRHSSRTSHKLQPGQTLDINTAGESDLTALPGVGPGLARRIVEYRTANGPFQSADDLQNVSGIGASKFDLIAPYVRL
ncbi:MAG: helix-hairpin-helix domain-containing protein, partial [Candidatus Eremiobacteraeota bacterium]|nr:helix-hairpin-helix domain-containing protein [Candidatus Eremiobacteraeota bacterium]